MEREKEVFGDSDRSLLLLSFIFLLWKFIFHPGAATPVIGREAPFFLIFVNDNDLISGRDDFKQLVQHAESRTDDIGVFAEIYDLPDCRQLLGSFLRKMKALALIPHLSDPPIPKNTQILQAAPTQ